MVIIIEKETVFLFYLYNNIGFWEHFLGHTVDVISGGIEYDRIQKH